MVRILELCYGLGSIPGEETGPASQNFPLYKKRRIRHSGLNVRAVMAHWIYLRQRDQILI